MMPCGLLIIDVSAEIAAYVVRAVHKDYREYGSSNLLLNIIDKLPIYWGTRWRS